VKDILNGKKWRIVQGDCLEVLKQLPEGVFQTCICSPPYLNLRDYGIEGQVGLESTPEAYVEKLTEIFHEVKRTLREDGILWLNLGDTYTSSSTHSSANLKPKDLVGVPWMTAFSLRDDGWYLRQCNIWQKPSCMPSSVRDRTTTSHEYIFQLTKSAKYFYDADAIREPLGPSGHVRPVGSIAGRGQSSKAKTTHIMKSNPAGRNKRSVWSITPANFPGAHFAVMPEEMVEVCVEASSIKQESIVLDPFAGAGTTLFVARKLGRRAFGIELNPEYVEIAEKRIRKKSSLF